MTAPRTLMQSLEHSTTRSFVRSSSSATVGLSSLVRVSTTYVLQNVATGQFLAAHGGASLDGTRVVQEQALDGPA
jgi:hypothetical protein